MRSHYLWMEMKQERLTSWSIVCGKQNPEVIMKDVNIEKGKTYKSKINLTYALKLFDDVIVRIDKGLSVVYLEFQKPFDKVPQKRLITRLQDMELGIIY